MNLVAIKTSKGYFISLAPEAQSYNRPNFNGFLVNGERPTISFNPNWWVVPGKPEKVEKIVSHSPINYRYELIDPAMESEKIPPVLSRDEVAIHGDEGWYWREAWRHLESLYQLKSDPQPDTIETVEFTCAVILEVDVIQKGAAFSYKTIGEWGKNGMSVTEKDVHHQLIDKILFPDIILPSQPCRLSSYQTFQIIRAFVKDHIDPRYATITSDYDFCFTVQKKVELAEPHSYRVDENNNIFSKRKRVPKYVTRTQTHRTYAIFEMTSKEKAYQGYTPIDGFWGNSAEDLRDRIDAYLNDLINFINEPTRECPQCKGAGILITTIQAGKSRGN